MNFIDTPNLVILNQGTRQNPFGSLSPLDRTLVSPSIAMNSWWFVIYNDCTSEHSPVLTTCEINSQPASVYTPVGN